MRTQQEKGLTFSHGRHCIYIVVNEQNHLPPRMPGHQSTSCPAGVSTNSI